MRKDVKEGIMNKIMIPDGLLHLLAKTIVEMRIRTYRAGTVTI